MSVTDKTRGFFKRESEHIMHADFYGHEISFTVEDLYQAFRDRMLNEPIKDTSLNFNPITSYQAPPK